MRRHRMPRRYPRQAASPQGVPVSFVGIKVFFVLMALFVVAIIGFFSQVDNSDNAAAAQQQVDDAQMAQVAMGRPCRVAHPAFPTKPFWPDWVKPEKVARFDIMGVRLYRPPQVVMAEIRTGAVGPFQVVEDHGRPLGMLGGALRRGGGKG